MGEEKDIMLKSLIQVALGNLHTDQESLPEGYGVPALRVTCSKEKA